MAKLKARAEDDGAAEARLPEAAVPDAVVEEVASEIASLVRRSELRCAFEVGRIVIERFYGGDQVAWRRKGPKATTLARLAERLHDRGVGGSATLHLCLGVYETLAALGVDSTWNLLTRSHVRAVLALPAPVRVSLLQKAQAGEWTVSQLEAAAARTPRKRRGGRLRTPAFDRALAQAERLFARDGPAFQELERLLTYDTRGQEAIHGRAVRFAESVEKFCLRISPKRLAEIGARKEGPANARHPRRATPKPGARTTMDAS